MPYFLSTKLTTRFAKPYFLFDISIPKWRRSLIIYRLTGLMCNSSSMNWCYWCIHLISSQAFESYLHAPTWVASLPLVDTLRCIRPTHYVLTSILSFTLYLLLNRFILGGVFLFYHSSLDFQFSFNLFPYLMVIQLDNVWLMGGLGSRGLLYHALLAQLVVQTATDPTESRKEER